MAAWCSSAALASPDDPVGSLGFRGLIDRVYAALEQYARASEDQAYKNAQYDATLDLLERRFPGQRRQSDRSYLDRQTNCWQGRAQCRLTRHCFALATDRRRGKTCHHQFRPHISEMIV